MRSNRLRASAAVLAGVVVAVALAVAGQWLGGLLGAAVIGAGIYVPPEIARRVRERRERADDADRKVAELDKVSAPILIPREQEAIGGPAWWLRADQRVVEFSYRPELGVLRA